MKESSSALSDTPLTVRQLVIALQNNLFFLFVPKFYKVTFILLTDVLISLIIGLIDHDDIGDILSHQILASKNALKLKVLMC